MGAHPLMNPVLLRQLLALPAGNPLRKFQRESAVIHSSVTNGLQAIIPKLYPHFHLLSLKTNRTQKKKKRRKRRGSSLNSSEVRKVALITATHPLSVWPQNPQLLIIICFFPRGCRFQSFPIAIFHALDVNSESFICSCCSPLFAARVHYQQTQLIFHEHSIPLSDLFAILLNLPVCQISQPLNPGMS